MLDKLIQIKDLRQFWKDEARDFTPWLSEEENLMQLADTLNIDINFIERESSVGGYDPATRGGDAPDGRKVKGTIHWVNASTAIDAEVRLFDRLFAVEAPDDVEEGHTFLENLNPNSLKVVTAKCEPALADTDHNQFADGIARYQFERMGYFCTDRDPPPATPSSTAPAPSKTAGRR